jgi:hypothetical protein
MGAANDVSGGFTNSAFNVIGEVGSATGLMDGVNGNQVGGGGGSVLDAMLDALGDNGGPTQTHALLMGSPAIDAADPAGMVAEDQRGFMRDATPDVGAFEFGADGGGGGPVSYMVDTLDDNDDGDITAGNFSLREAILMAMPGDTIDLTGISGEICLDSRLPRIPRGVTVIGFEDLTLNLNCVD